MQRHKCAHNIKTMEKHNSMYGYVESERIEKKYQITELILKQKMRNTMIE